MFEHHHAETITAVPHDIPVVGFHTKTINTLRLWSAEPSQFPVHQDLLKYKRETEAVSELLYPDDTHDEGKILRLKQQYFLVSASLQTILNHQLKQYGHLRNLHHHVCIHINDTHPVLAIPELMRILIDEQGLGWEEAWENNDSDNFIHQSYHVIRGIGKMGYSTFSAIIAADLPDC